MGEWPCVDVQEQYEFINRVAIKSVFSTPRRLQNNDNEQHGSSADEDHNVYYNVSPTSDNDVIEQQNIYANASAVSTGDVSSHNSDHRVYENFKDNTDRFQNR